MMRIPIPLMLRQVVRGAGTLPFVGNHPGLPLVGGLAVLATIPGIREGSPALALVSSVGCTLCVAVPFCIGAHARATCSDRKLRREAVRRLLDLWVNAIPDQPARSRRIAFRMKRGRDARLEAWIDLPPPPFNDRTFPDPADVMIPEGLRARLETILAGPFDGAPPARPGKDLLAPMTIPARDLSAHETIAARALSHDPESIPDDERQC